MAKPGNSREKSRSLEGKTPHGEQRTQEAQEGDVTRQVGDVNRVVREGRLLQDAETGYYVYVKGQRVVIVDPANNQQITRFKNSRANTQKRIKSSRWKPIS
jgi:hypothetical protein